MNYLRPGANVELARSRTRSQAKRGLGGYSLASLPQLPAGGPRRFLRRSSLVWVFSYPKADEMNRCLSFLTRRVVPLVLLGLSLPRVGHAQQGATEPYPDETVRLVGEVVDRRTGQALPAAEIQLFPFPVQTEPIWSGQSDGQGRFRTETVPIGAYQVAVEAPPFSSLSYPLVLSEGGVVDIRVEMVGVDYQLEPIVATARRQTNLERAEFYERREAGFGHFVTREDIEARGPLRVSDIFRQIPGARVIQGGGFSRSSITLRGACTPRYVIDGMLLTGRVAIDDLLSAVEVEAVEVYHRASVPLRYSGQTTCGVIMIWTRDPVAREATTLTWKRVVGGLGVGILSYLWTR